MRVMVVQVKAEKRRWQRSRQSVDMGTEGVSGRFIDPKMVFKSESKLLSNILIL